MARIGRNEPCPYKSGKKFKKYHGLLPAGNLNFEHLGTVSTKAEAAEFRLLGLPGMNLDLVFHAGYSDRESLKNVSNLPGEYKVLFTLNRPGYPLRSERMISSSEQLKGDSHLAISAPVVKHADGRDNDFDLLRFEANTDNGNFVFHGKPNKKGMIGTIETDPFSAEHFVRRSS